jgi:hypothetical protein
MHSFGRQHEREMNQLFQARFDESMRSLMVLHDNVSFVAFLLGVPKLYVYRRLNAVPNRQWWRSYKLSRSKERKKARERRKYHLKKERRPYHAGI